MILSVSRRTDIPAFYTEWFLNRLKEGYLMVRNPMNYHQVSKIQLSSDVVDCIVFWTKNPEPLLPYLQEINQKYPFYFQYTINAYGKDIEPNLPPLEERIASFSKISEEFGKDRVIWRYDPIMLSVKYNTNWHLQQFYRLAERLKGQTNTCVFSFVDIYDKVKNNLKAAEYIPLTSDTEEQIAFELAGIATKNNIKLKNCAEDIELDKYGIEHSCCIDQFLIEKLIDCPITVKKDPVQRSQCHCVESIDIGQYNTCKHGCKYCYANFSMPSVIKSYSLHEPHSPLLIGHLEDDDAVHDRKVKSIKEKQYSLF